MHCDLRNKSWPQSRAPGFWDIFSKDCRCSVNDTVTFGNPYTGESVEGAIRIKRDFDEPDEHGFLCYMDVLELIDGRLPPNSGGNNPI
jgi:hypothetical protein